MSTQPRSLFAASYLKLGLRWLIWPAVIVFVALVNPFRGSHAATAYWTLGIFALMFGLFFGSMWFAKRTLWRHFLAPSPEPAIAWLRAALSRSPVSHVDHTIASATATARALYGQFSRALDELDERKWQDVPAGQRAAALQARALVHYLSHDDLAAGLRLAREAQALVQPDPLLGADARRGVTATYVDIGRALLEQVPVELAPQLVRRAGKARAPSVELVTLWAAALAYQQTGRSAQAAQILSQLAARAPHCTPLHQFNTQATPTLRTASPEDSALGQCAVHPDTAALGRCLRCGDYSCSACCHSLSDRATICARCYDLLGELRQRYTSHERRIRAAGALLQIGAVGFLLVCVSQQFLLSGAAWWLRILSLLYSLPMAAGFFWIGRALRGMPLGFRARLGAFAIPMLFVLPAGTAVGVYYLWLAYGPLYAQLQSPDYVRSLSVRRDLDPGSPWPFALGLLTLLVFNFLAFFTGLILLVD